MSEKTFTVSATIEAPLPNAWEYWNDPQHIIKWNFASPDWHCPSAENDLKPSGKLRSRMEARDGSMGFDFEATYDEVLTNELISYTIADGRKVSTSFENENGKTRITSVCEAENTFPIEMQRDGWQAILNNFKNYAESR